jgi:uncharacterized membrane protein
MKHTSLSVNMTEINLVMEDPDDDDLEANAIDNDATISAKNVSFDIGTTMRLKFDEPPETGSDQLEICGTCSSSSVVSTTSDPSQNNHGADGQKATAENASGWKGRASDYIYFMLLALVLVVLSGFAQLLLMVSIYFRSGSLGGAAGWHGNAMISIMIVLLTILLIYVAYIYITFRKKKQRLGVFPSQTTKEDRKEKAKTNNIPSPTPLNSPQVAEAFPTDVSLRVKRLFCRVLLPLTILLLILTEVAVILSMTRNSVFPLQPPFGQDALIEGGKYVPSDCGNIQEMLDEAKRFYRNNTKLDFNDVKIIYGGTALGGAPSAHVIDNTIYLPKNSCPWPGLFVHEFVHIYQEQTGYWTGKGGPGKVFQYFAEWWQCSECLYDYGGYEALQAKMELALSGDGDEGAAGDIREAFGAEQMAMIVEDYYDEHERCHSNMTDLIKENYAWHCEALEYYATQILVR